MCIYICQENEEKWALPISTACTLSAAHTLTLTDDVLGKNYASRNMLSRTINGGGAGAVEGGGGSGDGSIMSDANSTLSTAMRSLRAQSKLKAMKRIVMNTSKEELEPYSVKAVYTLHGAQFATEQMRAPALYREEASFCRTDIGEWATLAKRKEVKVSF